MDSIRQSFNAGQAKGQAKESTKNVLNTVGDAAQSAKDTIQEGGQQLKAKAQGAAEAVKDALNK